MIRPATQADYNQVEKLWLELNALHSEMESELIKPVDAYMDEDDYRAVLKDPLQEILVLDEGQFVGGITMMFEDDYASIANVAVHPEHRGQGLGGMLMSLAEEKAQENNHSELRLATHVLLTENISLYLHLGWAEIERDDVRVYMKKEV